MNLLSPGFKIICSCWYISGDSAKSANEVLELRNRCASLDAKERINGCDLKLATEFWNVHFPENIKEITLVSFE